MEEQNAVAESTVQNCPIVLSHDGGQFIVSCPLRGVVAYGTTIIEALGEFDSLYADILRGIEPEALEAGEGMGEAVETGEPVSDPLQPAN